jgi:hypothetical protein
MSSIRPRYILAASSHEDFEATGEIRSPKIGEWFWSPHGCPACAKVSGMPAAPILDRRIPECNIFEHYSLTREYRIPENGEAFLGFTGTRAIVRIREGTWNSSNPKFIMRHASSYCGSCYYEC